MRRNLIILLLLIAAVGATAFCLTRLAIAAAGRRMFVRVSPPVILPSEPPFRSAR